MKQHDFLKTNHLLVNYTSWKIGGPADYFYQPADLEDLSLFLRSWHKTPVIMLGAGTNVLIRDRGIRGLVIYLGGRLEKLQKLDGNIIRAEAGVSLRHLVQMSVDLGFMFLSGIPGTVGGALAMNAGAYSCSIWDYVVAVETIDIHGEIRLKKPDEFQVGYRQVIGLETGKEWFVAGHFKFAPGDIDAAKKIMSDILAKRRATQPLQEPNCGSVFKNPPGDYAARLIEKNGFKGYRIGDAAVSEKHANFIVNKGKATSQDVEKLMHLIMEKVLKEDGIELIPEVRILGE